MGEHITALIQSIPHGEPADGYAAALTMDVGSLQPSRGGFEVAREGITVYQASLRAFNALPGQIARAEHACEQGGHEKSHQ